MMQLSASDYFPEVHGEPILDQQLLKAVTTNLFEDRPAALNALFRFQIGSSTFDGYEFAKEAWKRVASVTNTSVSSNNAGFGQSLEALRAQKEAVKKELKKFDAYFCKFYGRQPSRLDKECLRKLYEFHKQLKAYISAEEAKAERSMLQHARAPTAPAPASSIANSALPARAGGHGGVLSVLNSPASGRPAPSQQELDEKVLRAEKRALKIKLRRFEDDFFRHNGHKPQSYLEVGAVREEYSRYKQLKETLQAAGAQDTPARPGAGAASPGIPAWVKGPRPGGEPGPYGAERDLPGGAGAGRASPCALGPGPYGRSLLSP